ncbi:hypothetical protein CYY_007676 [Polysphondylium violaceum]|uniref:TOG domain-containing protein n=1 Tax=Polysphondylium violaceum TaxID=133409 RepID=A0A8J4PQJ6_9MYCE|nr:hypothetical protein CYY_007676 [Polysphondylium violaceum]
MKTSKPTLTPASSIQSRVFSPAKQETSVLNFDDEKELQKKIEEIFFEFKNKDTRDWSFRYKSLIVLQRIVNGNAIEFKTWTSLLRYLSPQLIEQLTELRSTIVKEACTVVTLLAQRMGSKFEPFASQYMQALIKMVIVKTAIISDAAHVTIRDVLMCVQTKNLLTMFLNGSLDPKNEQLRKRCCEYILIVLQRAIEEPGMILTTSVPALEKSISHLLVDGGSDVRLTSRYCFWAYSELAQDAAIKMMYTFTPTTQKNLFTVVDSLPAAQQEVAEKIKQSLFEEEQSQRDVGDSNDLDFDINDFKKDDSSNDTTTTSTTSINRSKTPTSSGRMSGLKAPRPSLGGGTTTKSTTTTSATNSTTQIKRAGSSLGMKSTVVAEPERTIKKPVDSASIIRSKSSLGTIRKPVSTTATTAAISSALSSTLTKTTSTSPNLSSTQSGRYSSIGTRAVISSSSITSPTLSKQTSSSNLTRSLPPSSKSPISATLTKSTSPTTSSSNLLTKSASSASSPSTPSSKIPAKRMSTATSSPTTPVSSPSTLTKNKATTTTTTTSTSSPLSSTLTKKTPTSTSTTASPLLSKSKSLPSASLESNKKRLSTEVKDKVTLTATTDDSDTILQQSKRESLNLDSFERSLNQNNNLAFHEISESLAGSIRDAKKGLSLYELESSTNELTLDDLDTDRNKNSSSSNNNIFNHNGSSSANGRFQFSLDNIKRSKSIEEDFKWIEEESGLDDDNDLIENDPFDFNDDDDNNDDQDVILDQEQQQQQQSTIADDDEFY